MNNSTGTVGTIVAGFLAGFAIMWAILTIFGKIFITSER